MKLNFTKDGLLRRDEFRCLVDAMLRLGRCVFYPGLEGKSVNGVDYVAVDLIVVDVNEIKDALETIASVYGLDIEFKKRGVNNEEN